MIRRMKPPSVIDLSYQKISIVYLTAKERPKVLGEYSADEHTIMLRSRMKWNEEANTLLHELYHAIYHCYRIAEDADEEKTVMILANGFMELMIRNPKLQDYFKKAWSNASK